MGGSSTGRALATQGLKVGGSIPPLPANFLKMAKGQEFKNKREIADAIDILKKLPKEDLNHIIDILTKEREAKDKPKITRSSVYPPISTESL